MNNDSLKNKIVLVTGASRGIGHGILLTLASTGATVIGTATTEKGATHITETLKNKGFQGMGMVLNASDVTSIDALIESIKTQFGVIDILINNAAVTQDNLMLRMKQEEWDSVIATDLSAIFHLSKSCLRGMIKNKFGRIVNIGSVVGTTGNAGQANYAAAKAGLIGFSKSLALEVGSRNITVNTVSPGFISTDMTDALTEEQRQGIFDRIPVQRLGTVDDIANAVLFLVSDSGAYITGHTLHVNGGMYMN